MEVTGIGLLNMDDYRMAYSQAAHSSQDFAEMFKRTLSSSDTPAPVQDDYDAPENSAPGYSKTKIDKTDRLYQLCLELETFLVKNLLSSMRNTVQKTGLVDDSYAGKIYEDMLWDEYAKDFTRTANFGLAEQAYRQLKHF